MHWRVCAVCEKPATFTCSGCKITNYCRKNHQKQHWKASHKSACKPSFKVEVHEIFGRYLVASRDISQGELILQEPPLIKGPKAFTSPVCLGCHDVIGDEKWECDGCGFPLCSEYCQVSENHFEECQVMMKRKYRAKIDPKTEMPAHYHPILALRILLLKNKSPEKYNKIVSLESHLNERLETALYKTYKKNIAGFLQRALGFALFDEKTILNFAGILDTNTFEVRVNKRRLRALYGTAVFAAHNCTPNVRHTFHGAEDSIAVSATVDIPCGTPIFTTYTQSFWGTLARRNHLLECKLFQCKCSRCCDPSELGTYIGAFRCIRCATKDNYSDGPKMVSTDPTNDDAPWTCSTCGHKISAKLVKSGNDNLRAEVKALDKSTPKALEEFLSKYGVESCGVLHPKNSFVVQVKHALVQMYGNIPGFSYAELPLEKLEKKIEYCRDLLDVADVLCPRYTRIRGQLLAELHATSVTSAKFLVKEEALLNYLTSTAWMVQVMDIMKTEPDFEEVIAGARRLQIGITPRQ